MGSARDPEVGADLVVVQASAAAGDALCAEVVASELRTRLPGVRVTASAAPSGDAVVAVVDDRLADAASTTRRLRESGWTVVPLADPEVEARLPVPSVLADRLWTPDEVAARADQLRLGGALAGAGPVLGVVLADPSGSALEVLAELARTERMQGVVTRPGGRLSPLAAPDGDGPDGGGPGDALDLVAVASSGGIVVTDDPATAGLALALGAATIGLVPAPVGAGDWPAGAVVVDSPERVAAALGPARARAADPAERRPARDRLDAALDAVAATVRELLAESPAARIAEDPAALRRRLAELEAAHEGLRRRVRAERLAFGRVAADHLRPPTDDDRQRMWVQLVAARQELEVAAERGRRLDPMEAAVAAQGVTIGRLEDELARLRAETAELSALRAEVDGLRRSEAALHELRASRLYLPLRVVARLRTALRPRD